LEADPELVGDLPASLPAHPEEPGARGTRAEGVSQGGRRADVTIATFTPIEVEGSLYPLARLLEDAVESGASVGFVHPMAQGEALAYWKSVIPEIRGGSKIVIAARRGGVLAGCVQLSLEQRANGRHRAEIAKLMVLRSARRQGIGRALMLAAEVEARRLGRTTLVLDTREGDPSEALYRSLGWQVAGVIPKYARSSDGNLDATVFYYRLLD
jgi:ribosomal protein S18 acetylase RimI-like enzyme